MGSTVSGADYLNTYGAGLYSSPDTAEIKAAAESGDFSKLIKETAEEDLRNRMLALSSSDSGVSNMGSADALTQLLMSAAASGGKMGQAEISLFMLNFMMQEMSSNDMAPLMSAMSALIPQLSGGDSSGAGASQPDASLAYSRASWGSTGYDTSVYTALKNSGASTAANIPSSAWKPVNAAITSDQSNRNPTTLRAVLDQFGVENSERYRAYRTTGRDTYCNIFVWDATSALGCEIPHWVDSKTGEARTYPDVKGAYELDANGVCDWMRKNGAANGWREVSAEEAQYYANCGKPAVTAFKNTSGAGHVQMVSPSYSGGYDSSKGPAVAQAGSRNLNYSYVSSTFSKSQRDSVRYYVHE